MYDENGQCSKETKIKVLKELVEMLGASEETEAAPEVAEVQVEETEEPILG